MTPSLFAYKQASQTEAAASTLDLDSDGDLPSFGLIGSQPERGPKLFFASTKTGEGVEDVFGYVVRKMVGRWEYEEAMVRFRDSSGEHLNKAIRLAAGRNGVGGGEDGRGWCVLCMSNGFRV